MAGDPRRDGGRGHRRRDPVRDRRDAVGPHQATPPRTPTAGRGRPAGAGACPRTAPARHRDRLLRGVRDRRLELARPVPRAGAPDPGHDRPRAVLGRATLGRLAAARLADRYDHTRFTIVSAAATGVVLLGAILIPSLPVSIALFALAGFVTGPVFPMVMVVAGDRYPERSSAVSGFLGGSAVVGSIIYPAGHGLPLGDGRPDGRDARDGRSWPSPARAPWSW